jgi:hypothetical protein
MDVRQSYLNPHDGGLKGLLRLHKLQKNFVDEGHGLSYAVNSMENTSGLGACVRTSGSTLILGGVCALT